MVSSRTEVPTEHAPDQRASQEGSGSDGHGNSSHSGGESLARIFFKDINFTLAERSRKQKDISNPSDFAVNSNIFIRLLLMELKRNKKERLGKEKRYRRENHWKFHNVSKYSFFSL